MAVINQVMYEELPGKANELREGGLELNRQVVAVYNAINGMRANWTGVRFNELAKAFNDLRPLFNSILGLVVGSFPTTIEQVANNYAVVDTGARICGVRNEPVQPFVEIESTDPKTFKFIQASVEEVKTLANQNFGYMIEQMNTIDGVVATIPWDSDAATTFRETFSSLKQQIISKIDEVKATFETTMAEALTQVQATEDANKVQ